jgi:3-ketosteroid 9alpha-monooxygenase subunit A
MSASFRKTEAEAAAVEGDALAYPEGWVQVAYSDDLAAGQVTKLHYFGEELVLFRTETGTAQVIDAYCAHLGAHLGAGGVVEGETIRCPFHAWQYGTDGLCKNVPYSDRIPARGAAVKAWPTREHTGIIWAWYSPVDNAPSWEPPALPEYEDPAWTDYILKKEYIVRTRGMEVIENVADIAHGTYVHGNPVIPTATFAFEEHNFIAELKIDLPSVGGATTNTVTAHGLGITVNRGSGYGSKTFYVNYTPIDRQMAHVRFSTMVALSTPEDPTGEIARKGAVATTIEFEKDIPIWENKIFRKIPLLVKEDGPIGRFRVWSRQFFPRPPVDAAALETDQDNGKDPVRLSAV